MLNSNLDPLFSLCHSHVCVEPVECNLYLCLLSVFIIHHFFPVFCPMEGLIIFYGEDALPLCNFEVLTVPVVVNMPLPYRHIFVLHYFIPETSQLIYEVEFFSAKNASIQDGLYFMTWNVESIKLPDVFLNSKTSYLYLFVLYTVFSNPKQVLYSSSGGRPQYYIFYMDVYVVPMAEQCYFEKNYLVLIQEAGFEYQLYCGEKAYLGPDTTRIELTPKLFYNDINNISICPSEMSSVTEPINNQITAYTY